MNKKIQEGITVISLLVGLVVAMICIIAILATYRIVVKISTESRIAATYDSQLQIGLANAQLYLQNAGFGLEGTSHLITDADITVQIDSVSKRIHRAILWRYQDNDIVVCHGLADIANAEQDQRNLVLLTGRVDDASCDSKQNLANVTWSVQNKLASLNDRSTDGSNPAQITWQESAATCTPYGAGLLDESTQHPVITFFAKTTTQHNINLSPLGVSVCLLNISIG